MGSEVQVYRQIGEIIRSNRKTKDLSQFQLAGRIGISRPSLANIEKGRQRVPAHLLYLIAQALQIALSDLLPPLNEVIVPHPNLEKEISALPPKAKIFAEMVLSKEGQREKP